VGEARWLTVRAAGGRDLEVLVDGPDHGTVLLFHDGTPTAAVRFPQLTNPAAKRGLRTVTYSRPGYAASTSHYGRSVADAVEDSEAILDTIGADRFVTLGWSGGGPHALACAALLPERCAAAATLGAVAPYGAAGLDWMAGMGPENIVEFGAAVDGVDRLTEYLEREAVVLRTVTGEDVAAALGGLVPEVDKAALTGEFAEVMAETFRRAVSTGIAGWRDDDLAFTRPWGFELGSIRVPIAVWQGAQDRMVPYDHGRWLAANIPGAQARLLDDEGHLSLVNHLDRILEDLIELSTGQS
jgi:pimeloyl-ACP methyl ester carboxylesterase